MRTVEQYQPTFEMMPSGSLAAEPNPEAHADVLVSNYGLKHASWIAESNVITARPVDSCYWSRVLMRLREAAS